MEKWKINLFLISFDVQVGVSIQMSSFNLTRIVTMSPFYTLVNKSSFELEVGEVQNNNGSSSKWHYISSTEVSAEFLFLLKEFLISYSYSMCVLTV